MINLYSILKSITLPEKFCLVKAMVFPVVMYGWEIWTIKKPECRIWCFWTVVLEKTFESPLDCKEIHPVNPKGDQPWVFIGRTDVETETRIFWPLDAKCWLIWKDPNAGKYWRQEEKGTTKDEMVGWHHQLNGHGFGWTPAVCDGQGGLACCSSWGRKESDTTEWAEMNWSHFSRVWLFAILWTIVHQAPLSMGFSRQEYWSGLPSPPPGDLPDPGTKPSSLTSPALAAGFFTTTATQESLCVMLKLFNLCSYKYYCHNYI